MDLARAQLGASALVAAGLALAGLFVGQGVARVRTPPATVSVRGVAERDVMADLATWTIATQATGSDLATVQARADADAAAVRAFLAARGFQPQEVEVRGSGVNQFYDSSRGKLVVTIRQRF